MKGKDRRTLLVLIGVLVTHLFALGVSRASAQNSPTVRDPSLAVRTVVTGLTTPVSMAFLDPDDFMVLEKNTGKVQRIKGGALHSTVLDLAVNFASERGLLGIALHPDFPENPGVYLYWTESTTGADSGNLAEVPLLGNRVDRYVWDGSLLTFEKNIIMLRAFQEDAGQPLRGNHDGGVLRFEKRKAKLRDLIKGALFHKDDGDDDRARLFIIIGDNGRRGQLQNLPDGPFGPGIDDDQFGGPEPDNAHLTGVILRINDDGTTPEDNPFFKAGAAMGGEAGANIQKIYAYGVRNSFGMAVDPLTGELWTQENSDDAFDEINRVEPGMNGGWIQIMGPVARIAQFKSIEVNEFGGALQQLRWPPTQIADTPDEALARLFVLPGSHYSDPEFSWKYAVAPAGIGFMSSWGLGPKYIGDLFVGAARTNLADGYLFRFKMTGNRKKLVMNDPRLHDRVADNLGKFDITESESLVFGEKFGIGTDIQTGPNGNLFVVSLSNGAVYEIFKRKWSEKEGRIK
ncbi:Aldose sugar dehydrogenase YliI [Geobacteraceae bacterium]|nr:Aldose sugar dehydrogenase YliI [Geobacteraceae bacterium]